jgi:predicted metal-dependent hydrolase
MTSVAYSVQVSPKAKHARLKVSAKNGLTVVVPKGFDESRIPRILYKKRDWLRRVGERFEEQKKFLVPEPPGELPERILLRIIGEEWAIEYRPTDAEIVSAVERPGNRLLVFGNIDSRAAVKGALQRWLSRKAHEHIVTWAKRLALEHQLFVSKLTVKCQRTRWASCSRSRTISVNLRLLFLPEPVVRYVLLHELAHTQQMNHSARFWATVRTLEADYQRLDAELRTAWRFIPAWIGPVATSNF